MTTTDTEPIPNPGSDEALELGCRCPVLHNAHGRGAMGTSGDDAEFWTNAACPLHGATISDPKDTPITIHGLVSQVECDVIDVTTAGREHRYVGGANTVTFATSYGRLTVPWPTHAATPAVGAELTLTISDPEETT